MKTNPKRCACFTVGALLVAAVSASIHPLAAQTEFVVNGDFSQGLTRWEPLVSVPPEGNSISVVDDGGNPVLQMSVNTLEGNGTGWHVQTWQTDGALNGLSPSTTYTLRFRARASVERPLYIDVNQYNYPDLYFYLGLRVEPTIGTTWQNYEITFRTVDDTLENPWPDPATYFKLVLAAGQALGTVWVDDISLQDTPPSRFQAADLPLFNFEPSETWLSGAIQNMPDPPDVVRGDTAHVHDGTAALKLSAGPNGRDYAEHQVLLDLSVDNWEMTFWAYVEHPENLANVTIALRSGLLDHLAWKWWPQAGLAAGWNQVVVPKTQFYGGFWLTQLTWSEVWDVGIKIETNDNGPASVWIDDVHIEPAAPDRRPPVISWVNLYSLSDTAVTVTWKTDESATSLLECGTGTSYGQTQSDGTLSLSHSLTLAGLAPNTLYHCQVSSADGGARTGRSGDFIFRTDPSSPWVPVDPAGRFQVGLYGVAGWDDTGYFNLASLDDPLRTRFTHFYGSTMRWETDEQLLDYLDALADSGRKAFVGIDNLAISENRLVDIQNRVEWIRDRDHGALAGWYLWDEPEYYPNEVTPAQLNAAYAAIKQVDSHPVTFAAPGFGPNYPFLGAMDYGILDPYPIPFGPPDSILTNLYQAQDAGKPFDFTVQSYQNNSYAAWPGDSPGPSRFPSRDETRVLAYLALNQGAGNIIFYGYGESHVFPGVTWQWLKAIDVANELVRLGPVYSSSDPPQIALQPGGPASLDVGVRQYQGKAYVTVVNKSQSPASGTLTFTGQAIQSATEVVTRQLAASTWTTVTDTWPGYGASIYEIALAEIPADPSGLSGTAISPTQVTLSWTDNSSNEDGFKVRRATSPAGPFSELSPSPGPGVTSFSDTTVSEGTQYWYSVTAYRTITPESGAATTGPVTTPLIAPAGLAGTPLAGRVNRLTWTDHSANETAFEVQRALKSGAVCGTYATIGTAPASAGTGSTVTYNDAGSGNNPPIASKTYCYRVRSSNVASQSAWAGPVLVKTAR